MFTKPTEKLAYEDIIDLVQVRKLPEGHKLDYKEKIHKQKLITTIASFANSSGGYLILGVSDSKDIVGISPVYENKPISEWINQVLIDNLEPPVFYEDPVLIEIPEKNEIVVVIHVPESKRKPHFSNEDHRYYIRSNDSTRKAKHTQIRDMFEMSRNRMEEITDFLKNRNITDPAKSNFGINKHSINLLEFDRLKPKELQPRILFSLIPSTIKDERVDLQSFPNWLKQHYNKYQPTPGVAITHPHFSETQLDGIVFKHMMHPSTSPFYFEVLQNGFVESGLSRTFFAKTDYGDAMSLSTFCIYQSLFLNFAKVYSSVINYSEEWILQVSFSNINGFLLLSFHEEKENLLSFKKFVCQNETNFSLIHRFYPADINKDSVNDIVKKHSTIICRVFGSNEEMAFGRDGNLDLRSFNWPSV